MALGESSFREVLAVAMVLTNEESNVRDSKLHQIVLQKLGRVNEVLDVGCGEGNLAVFIAKRTGAKVAGVDISESGFHKAEEKADKAGHFPPYHMHKM